MSNTISQSVASCRVCRHPNLAPVLDLGPQPLANSLLSGPTSDEIKVPLILCRCEQCLTIQLSETVNPSILFQHYVWVTGTSSTAKSYSETFCERLSSHLSDGPRFIIEIASNDGTFLRPFVRQGDRVIGVDPAQNIAKFASETGVPTLNDFFGLQVAKGIRSEHGLATAVFARNVIPHVADVHDVLEGLAYCLSADGVAAIEFHRADIILRELHYDSIYHEHVCYHSIHSLSHLLETYGLYPFDVELSPISGGSFVLYASKQRKSVTKRLNDALVLEIDSGIRDRDAWERFAKNAITHKQELKKIVNEFSSAGQRIIGWGASARSSTMLNFCDLNHHDIEAVLDNAPLKHGLLTPGTHIPIQPPESIRELPPDVVLLLAWNFKEEILDELKGKFSWRGKVILPLPDHPQVISL